MVAERQGVLTTGAPAASGPLEWDEAAAVRERTPDSRDRVAVDRDLVADDRDGVAVGRDDMADDRDVDADGRDGVAALRDQVASVRDRLAEVRDEVADQRDREADRRDDRDEASLQDEVTAADARAQAELDRGVASIGRHTAASARSQAALDRDKALVGRHTAADARVQAGVDRGTATTGRDSAADDRHQAGIDRLAELDRRLTWGVVVAMLAAVPDAIVAVDSVGRIVYLNDQAELQFGWPRTELLGKSIEVLVPDRFAADHPAVRLGYFADPSTRPMAAGIRVSARRHDGSEFPVEISLSTTEAGPDRWVLAAIRDVTKSRQTERDLEAARVKAVLADGAKDKFLSRMSHELRTPLNAVLGFAQLLAMDEMSSDQEGSVKQIVGAGQQLLALIDEVLDISEMSQGAMRLSMEAVAVREVVEEAVQMIRPLADRRDLRLSNTVSSSTYLFADRLRLKEALMNLLANAVNYNRTGGWVHIEGEIVASGRFRLTVADSGIGIAAIDLDRLFTPFERLSATSDIEGSGLGLALTKLLVLAMNAEIGVTSDVGIGSSFWIELPVSSAHPTGEIANLPEPIAPTPVPVVKTVLYVEDNPSNITLLERMLAHLPGLRLMVAVRGKLGIDLAFEHRPDLILLDLGLPDMDGEEVLRQLKADQRTAETPVVVISGDAMPHRRQEMLALGASIFITKPFDKRQLLGIIDDETTTSIPHNYNESTPPP